MDMSIWLIPREDQLNFFRKIINDLAHKYNTCSFAPHVTLYSFNNNFNKEEIITGLNNYFLNEKRISLEFDGIKYSDLFTKTLYCQLKMNEQIESLYQKTKKIFLKFGDYQLNPHLSLIYKNNMSVDDKQKEIKKLTSFIPRRIIFDKLALIIRDKGPIKKEEDVLDWREILKINLL